MTTAELFVLVVRILITLGVMVAACAVIFLLYRRHADIRRRRAYFRGRCRDCGYNPDTGTRTCPECAGPVLDLRLFRPVGDADPARHAEPDATAEQPEFDLVNQR